MLPSGIGENVDRYYDKTGEISMEQDKLLLVFQKGCALCWMKRHKNMAM